MTVKIEKQLHDQIFVTNNSFLDPAVVAESSKASSQIQVENALGPRFQSCLVL